MSLTDEEIKAAFPDEAPSGKKRSKKKDRKRRRTEDDDGEVDEKETKEHKTKKKSSKLKESKAKAPETRETKMASADVVTEMAERWNNKTMYPPGFATISRSLIEALPESLIKRLTVQQVARVCHWLFEIMMLHADRGSRHGHGNHGHGKHGGTSRTRVWHTGRHVVDPDSSV